MASHLWTSGAWRGSAGPAGRIIRDAGEVTPELRAKEEAHRVMALLKKFNVGYYQLETLLKYRAKNEAIFKALPIATKQQVSMDFKKEN